MFVRSNSPGSCSLGYTWEQPGDVVEMPAEQAAELVAINPDQFEAFNEHPDPPSVEDDQAPPAPKKRATRTAKVTEPDPNA